MLLSPAQSSRLLSLSEALPGGQRPCPCSSEGEAEAGRASGAWTQAHGPRDTHSPLLRRHRTAARLGGTRQVGRSRSWRGRKGSRHSVRGHRPPLLAALRGSWGHTWNLPEPVRMGSVALPGGTPVSRPRSGMEQRLEVPRQGAALPSRPAPGAIGADPGSVAGAAAGARQCRRAREPAWLAPACQACLACSSQDSDAMISPADGGDGPGQEGGGISRLVLMPEGLAEPS